MNNKNEAILIAAFGTSHSGAAEAFSRFELKVRNRFPQKEIRWAYTSSMIRKKLLSLGNPSLSVSEALCSLASRGYGSVAICSLHTIPGVEYDKIQSEVSVFLHKPATSKIAVTVSKPLLSSYNDALRVAKALLENVPEKRSPRDAVVFMGHGSSNHASDLFYVAMSSIISELDRFAFLGTVEGHPSLSDVVYQCKVACVRKVWLIPFMSIAGDHVVNDMAGDEPDSWKSVLSGEGISCESILEGTLDNTHIASIWLDHMDTALDMAAENLFYRH